MMGPEKKMLWPFLWHLIVLGLKGIGGGILGMLGLLWLAGWVALIPVQVIALYIEEGCPIWALILIEIFYLVPAAAWAVCKLAEEWESYLLKRGWSKS